MAGVLGSMHCHMPDEWRMVQIMVRPELEPNLGSLAFQAIIRLIAAGDDSRRARNRLGTMIAAFGPFGGENALRPVIIRMNSAGALRAIQERHWPLLRQRTFLLKLEELAGMYHVPSPEKVNCPRLETNDSAIPHACLSGMGIRVGVVSINRRERVVRLDPVVLLRHVACFGGTGTGKSTLLRNMALDLIGMGIGVTVMEPHGSLISDLMASIPAERLDDVVLIRFSDVSFPVGLNVLTARPGFEFLTVDELVEICRRIDASDSWGPVLDMTLRHAAYATIERGGTLIEMARILDDDAYMQAVAPNIRNPETRRFFQRLQGLRPSTRSQKVASTMNRLQRFLGTPFVRNVVGQQRSALDIRRFMDERKIVLFDLSNIGVTNAQFLGSLLTLLYRQAALSRVEPTTTRYPQHVLFMDECSWFISNTVGEMADQTRKFGLGMVLAAQRLGQLKPDDTREAVFGNVGNVICFELGDWDDAMYLARHFNTPGLMPEDIRSLGRYEIYAQLVNQGAKLPAFRLRAPGPPPRATNVADRMYRIVSRSRAEYALPRQRVEMEIAAREGRSRHDEPEKRRH